MPTLAVDIGVRTQRERIFAGMAACCAKKTFSASTIGDIVNETSISRATFYKHFANKRECFDATVAHFTAQLAVAATDAHAASEPGFPALRESAAAVLGLLDANPAYARLVLIEAPAVDPSLLHANRELLIELLQTEWGSKGVSGPSPQFAFGRAQVLLALSIALGSPQPLLERLPELVYIALLPCVGQDKALQLTKPLR